VKKIIIIISYLCVAGMIAGCATILNGPNQKVNVTTPKGQQETAIVDGKSYTVPSVIEVRRQNKDILVANAKCPDQQALLTKSVSGTFFVNILSGGVFGSTTDYASGDMWQYDNKNVVLPKCASK
jgi:hypothetical protein